MICVITPDGKDHIFSEKTDTEKIVVCLDKIYPGRILRILVTSESMLSDRDICWIPLQDVYHDEKLKFLKSA